MSALEVSAEAGAGMQRQCVGSAIGEGAVERNGLERVARTFGEVVGDKATTEVCIDPPGTPLGICAVDGGRHVAEDEGQDGNRFVALVFDRLSQQSRVLAVRGALDYLASARTTDRIAVFGVGLGLTTYAPFTNHGPTLAAALDGVARDALPEPATSDALAQMPRPGQRTTEPRPESANSWESLQLQQNADASIDGLFAVVSSLASMPGRKSVVLFAEGFELPLRGYERLLDTIRLASTAGVAIYTVDARGLLVESDQQLRADDLRDIGRVREASGANLAVLERLGSTLIGGPDGAMTWMARATGGFVVRDRNEFATPLAQMDVDRRFHYLLSYLPPDADRPGDWRRIDVRVRRDDVSVRHRAGYTLPP